MLREVRGSRVFDVDGVLIPPDHKTIPPTTLARLEQLEREEVLWTIASGRNLSMIRLALGQAALPPVLIVENGGRIVTREGETLFFDPISEDHLCGLEGVLRDDALEFACFTPRNSERYVFCCGKQGKPEHIWEAFKGAFQEMVFDAARFLAMAIRHQTAKVSLVTTGPLRFGAEVNVTFNEGCCYDVNAPNANKGAAARMLAQLNGITAAATWVYGNDNNDVPMFLPEFGRRYAVGAVPDRLRELSTHHITPAELLDHIN